jgi:hypothetical protein
VEGKITHLTKFGAFARLSEDLEGLIHLSEISEQRIAHPKEVVKEGDQVTLRIIKIDPERRRIALSMRKVDSPAYADLDWKMALATEVEGVQLVEGQEVTQPVEEKAIEEPQAPESAEEPQTPDAAEESQVSESAEGPQVVEVAEEPQAAEVATELEQPGETTEVQASAEENQSTNAGTGEDEEAMTPSTESNVQE